MPYPTTNNPNYTYLDPIEPGFIEGFFVHTDKIVYRVRRNDLETDVKGEYFLDQNEIFGFWLLEVLEAIKEDRHIAEYFKKKVIRGASQLSTPYEKDAEVTKYEQDYSAYQLRTHCSDGSIKDYLEYWGYNCDSEWLLKLKDIANNNRNTEELEQCIRERIGSGYDFLFETVDINTLTSRLLFDQEIHYVHDQGAKIYYVYPSHYFAKSVFLEKVYTPPEGRKKWADAKRYSGLNDFDVYIFSSQKGFLTKPFFHLYDLMCNGDFCRFLFDFFNDVSINATHKAKLLESIIKLGRGENMKHLRMLENLYVPYRKLGGFDIHFWPWCYDEIKHDFSAFYKEVTQYETKRKMPYGFLNVCLPAIVEEVLPAIRKAIQAVALVLLIRNAKDFSEEWQVRFSAEAFKERMLTILRLDEFAEQTKNYRMSNKQVRAVARSLYDEYPVLQKYTYLVEGD